jgi:hypothetical protein
MAPNPTYIIGMSAPLSRLASSLFLLFVACAEGQGPTGQDLGPPDLGAPDAEGADASDAGALPDDTGAVTLDAGELDAQSRDVPALDPTRFGPTAGLATARSSHSATLLADGRVLVVGGFGATGRPLASTELYDPQTGQWSPGPTLDQARANHLALRLPSGQVIIAGGGLDNNVGAPAGRGILASVVLFDSTNGDLVPAAPLTEGRSHAAATLLEDGRVLVVGGSSGTRTTQPNYGDALGNSEIYEPAADRWSPGPPLNTPRYLHSLLPPQLGRGRGHRRLRPNRSRAAPGRDPPAQRWIPARRPQPDGRTGLPSRSTTGVGPRPDRLRQTSQHPLPEQRRDPRGRRRRPQRGTSPPRRIEDRTDPLPTPIRTPPARRRPPRLQRRLPRSRRRLSLRRDRPRVDGHHAPRAGTGAPHCDGAQRWKCARLRRPQ